MYIDDVLKKSLEFNGVCRIHTESGDTLEGKITSSIPFEGMLEFSLSKGGTMYISLNRIESITLLDNLQILEEANFPLDK